MSWELTGNAGTDPATNFLGTTAEANPKPLIIKTNGAEALRIDTVGNVGIGTTLPTGGKLTIADVPTPSFGIVTQTDSLGRGILLTTTDYNYDSGLGSVLYISLGNGTGNTANSQIDAFNNATRSGGNLILQGSGGGNVGIGTTSPNAKLTVIGDVRVTGDVILMGADCAEEFDTAETVDIDPGTVVVFGQEGMLHQSHQAYDKRVAGVISGAGDYKPGLILDRRQSQDNRVSVALVGKVYCKVDAQFSPIEVGDLLTTSPTPGHAMKANDSFKAFGSVIGKALRPLKGGQGMIPILIALQ